MGNLRMRAIKVVFLSISILISAGSAAQIVDDSTKLVYGPSTISFETEYDIKFNTGKTHSIDTGLYDMENFSIFDKSHRKYQDLGANGTALWPIWYQGPSQIGLRSGFHSYDPFFKTSEDFNYYNTKSPFMDLGVSFGGVGRSQVDFTFARNVNENWNVGFNVNRLESDKQIGPAQSQGDKNAISTAFDIYNYFKTKDDKYLVLGYFQRFSHQVEETGGVYTEVEEPTDADLFQYEDSPIKLSGAQNSDKRINAHLFQQYRVASLLQIYHQFDFLNQRLGYIDENDGSPNGGYNAWEDYYENIFLNNTTTTDANKFRTIRNELGIKGDISKGFYSAFIRLRNAENITRYIDESIKANEVYVGGTLRYDINENNSFGGQAEFLQTGDFKFDGNIDNKFFEAGYRIKQYQPSVLEEQYLSNHHYWNNNFRSTLTNTIEGKVKVDTRLFEIRPKASITTIDNYVFYNEEVLPMQSQNSIVTTTLGADVNLFVSTSKQYEDGIRFENELIYSRVDNDSDNAIRLPQLYYYGKLYWSGFIFKRSMQINFGVNLYFRDAYYGLDYDPVIQQYFLQNEREFKSYFVADAFLDFKVDSMRVFFRLNQINQENNNGYFVTPYYPGQKQVIDLGIRWQFFD